MSHQILNRKPLIKVLEVIIQNEIAIRDRTVPLADRRHVGEAVVRSLHPDGIGVFHPPRAEPRSRSYVKKNIGVLLPNCPALIDDRFHHRTPGIKIDGMTMTGLAARHLYAVPLVVADAVIYNEAGGTFPEQIAVIFPSQA